MFHYAAQITYYYIGEFRACINNTERRASRIAAGGSRGADVERHACAIDCLSLDAIAGRGDDKLWLRMAEGFAFRRRYLRRRDYSC